MKRKHAHDKCGRKTGKELPSELPWGAEGKRPCTHRRSSHDENGCHFCPCQKFVERIPR